MYYWCWNSFAYQHNEVAGIQGRQERQLGCQHYSTYRICPSNLVPGYYRLVLQLHCDWFPLVQLQEGSSTSAKVFRERGLPKESSLSYFDGEKSIKLC